MAYRLQRPSYYRPMFDGGDRLFACAWRTYKRYLNSDIDNPRSDADVLEWLELIASERVNNSDSSFYIYGV